MKRIGYNMQALLATLALCGLASTALAVTPTPNGVYAPDPAYVRFWNDLGPPATVTLVATPAVGMPTSVVWSYDTPFDVNGWAEKGLWQLSGDGGASKLLFPNLCNYAYEADFTITGTNVSHAEGGLEVSPWWNDDGGYFMANIGGEITFWNGVVPSYPFSTNFGISYSLGTTMHQKIVYLAGAAEPTITTPATIEYSVILAGTPYSSGPMACYEANPLDPPHHTYGQLDDTKLGGQVMGGPVTVNGGHPTGAGTLQGTFNNIQFRNLDGVTAARSSSWGALKNLYR